jgi:hypothetical protein
MNMLSKIYTASERAALEKQATPVTAVVRGPSANSAALAKIDEATQALAEVRDIWSAKRAVDAANVLVQLVRALECSDTVEKNARGLAIEARRTFGMHWREAGKNTGAMGIGPVDCTTADVSQSKPRLSDIGVHPNVAAESVKLAELAERHPTAYAALKSGEITKAKALSALRPPKDEPEPFHVLIESGALREAICRLVAKWPSDQHRHVPQVLRDIADEIEGAC